MKILKWLFSRSSEKKNGSGGSSESKTVETKKCLNCLKRVSVDNYKCPYCKSNNFQF